VSSCDLHITAVMISNGVSAHTIPKVLEQGHCRLQNATDEGCMNPESRRWDSRGCGVAVGCFRLHRISKGKRLEKLGSGQSSYGGGR
jgi:hypothetical protein